MDKSGALPPKHFVGPDKEKLLQANPVMQKVLFARLESLDENDVEELKEAITPDTLGVLSKIFPELVPVFGPLAHAPKQDQGQPDCEGAEGDTPPAQGGGDSKAFSMSPASSGAKCPVQVQSVDPTQGFAKGGLIASRLGFSKGGPVPYNAGMKTNIGEVNKGIPTNSLAMGGMPRVAPPPHAMGLATNNPASGRFASRMMNDPHKFDSGGVIGSNENYAVGGPTMPPQGLAAPPQGQGQPMSAGPTGDPDTDQAIANQKTAEQIVPQDGKNDGITAKVSKGEFVMDNATVQYFGIDKLIKMQEKAHEGITKHIMKQDAQQNEGQDQAQPQGLASPPQGQGQQQAGPPTIQPQPPMQAPPSSIPNAQQQRIQQTNSPRPHNPLSLAG